MAASETFLEHILGLDCYTKAIMELTNECNSMTSDQRCWLAVKFTSCFLISSGLQPLRCENTRSIGRCTESMDVKTFNAYSQFYTNVHRYAKQIADSIYMSIGILACRAALLLHVSGHRVKM